MVSQEKSLRNLYAHNDWRQNHLRVAATNTAGATFRWTATVDSNKCVEIESIVAMSSASITSILLGIMTRGATFQPIEYTPSPAASVYYSYSRPLTLYEGQKIGVKFVGATAGDSLNLFVKGKEKYYSVL